MLSEAKTFYLKGGETALAITRRRKEELIDLYVDWLKRSQAVIVVEYAGLTMKMVDDLRQKMREANGEFHIVKNTLGKRALEAAGMAPPGELLEGSTAIAFAFQDVAAAAKTISEFARTSEFVKIKGGYLGTRVISAAEVKALAELPPLPVVRAQLLGVISAPASKLVRTLAEPARALAAVIKAYADQEPAKWLF